MPHPTSSIAPGTNVFPITPSDANPLPRPIRFIRSLPVSGVAGTLKIQTLDGDVVTTEIAKGEKLELVITKVFATGTTATGLEGHV